MKLVEIYLCFSYSLTKNKTLQNFMIAMEILNKIINCCLNLAPFIKLIFLPIKKNIIEFHNIYKQFLKY